MHEYRGFIIILISVIGVATLVLKVVQYFAARKLGERVIRAESEAPEFRIAGKTDLVPLPVSLNEHIKDANCLYAPSPVSETMRIFPEFDICKGNPPDWSARRNAVFERDHHSCQVPGCPSIDELEVHHKEAVNRGSDEEANHSLENLISLCRFHHFLADNFHSKVADRICSNRYNAVPAYEKQNPVNFGFHKVDAHVQRIGRASETELSTIKSRYGLTCSCGGTDFRMKIFKRQERLRVTCPNCKNAWLLFWGLAEEVGAQLTTILNTTRNHGTFPLSELANIRDVTPLRIKLCADCAEDGIYVMLIPRIGRYGKFWGCPNWWYDPNHRTQRWQNGDQKIADVLRRLFP